jgi:hypothetical protein
MASLADPIMQDKIHGMAEFLVGGTVSTIPLWARALDDVAAGLHGVTAVGGFIIAVHGVWRIVRRRQRRSDEPGKHYDRS